MLNNYTLFESQLSDACKYFPNLRVKSKNGRKYLKGTIDIRNSEQLFVKSFLIEIHYSERFPYRFPLLFEVGGDIPCHPDWHKYSDNSCCITVEPYEILQCKQGVSIPQFINQQVIPYLANQCYKKVVGKYKNEFSHGKQGLIEYYTDLMGTSDSKKWIQYVKYAFGIDSLKIRRNDPCICGSGKKFKSCHDAIFYKIKQIEKDNIIKHFTLISI
jgi:hypothetical protein